MDFQEMVKFANANNKCAVATVEGDQPRVRILNMWFADATGFYFQTETVKALYKQLEKNKKVALVFHSPKGSGPGTVLRVDGEAEFLNDTGLKRKVWEDRPNLRGYGLKGPEDPRLAVFRVGRGEAYFWTIANNMKESAIERTGF